MKNKQIKQLKKEIKKLRKLAGKQALEKQHWESMYKELDRYVEWQYNDY